MKILKCIFPVILIFIILAGCDSPFNEETYSKTTKGSEAERYKNIMKLNYSDTVITGRFHDWRDVSKYRSVAGYHNGYDYAAPEGTAITAGWEGTVSDIAYWGYGEYAVQITGYVNCNKQMVQYGHLNNIKVNKGEKIKTGQIIGYIAVDHLDLKMKINNQYYDFGK
jgi:murein DD-endopeptidase MepM/ murein hydrolase activator NlpD